MQLPENNPVELLTKGSEPDLLYDVFGEPVCEKGARTLSINSSSRKIEELFVFKLPDGRPVRTLDVIRKNLELRLSVDRGFVREKKVFVELPGIRVQGTFTNEYLPAEDGAPTAVKDSLIELLACAVRFPVIYRGMTVGMLAICYDVQAINHALCAFVGQRHIKVVTRELRTKRNRTRAVDALALLDYFGCTNVESEIALFLQSIVIELRTL